MTTPRKRKPKSKYHKVNVSVKAEWKRILKDIDKEEIPFDLLLGITVNLIDDTQINIDIKELLSAGHDPEELKDMLDERFKSMDRYIQDIDFYISIDDVAKIVQPLTDQILKDL